MKNIQKFNNFLNENIEEDTEKDNMKNITSSRPHVIPTPQTRSIRKFDDKASELNPDDEGLTVKIMFGKGAMRSLDNGDYQQAVIDGTFITKTFETEGEKEAYFQGCNDMSGNEDYLILTPEHEIKLGFGEDNIDNDFYENEE